MNWEQCGGHMGWGWMGGLVWLTFLVGIALLVLFAVRSRSEGPRPPGEAPLDIAKQRYARGEITRDQFEQLKHDLA